MNILYNEIMYKNNNNIKNSYIIKYIYFAVLLVTLSYFCVLPMRDIQIRHVVVFIGSVLFYILAFIRLMQSRYKLNLMLRLLIIIGIVTTGILVSTTDKILELVYTSLNFLAFFILMTTDNPIVLTKKMMNWTFRVFLLMAIVLFMVANSSVAYLFENGHSTTALVLGMTNPNFTAMMLLGISNILLINLKETRYKFFLFIVICGIGYLIWLTEARSSIVTFAFSIIYYLFLSNKNIPKFLLIIIFLGVLFFAPAYMYLYSSGWSGIFLGKEIFSGRIGVYNEYLNLLDTKYYLLFGNLGEVQFANAHNAPLSIMSSIGIVGLVITYFSYYLHLVKMNKNALTPISRLAIVCLLCMFIQSCAEATFFTGVYPSISFMFLYTVLANGVIKD